MVFDLGAQLYGLCSKYPVIEIMKYKCMHLSRNIEDVSAETSCSRKTLCHIMPHNMVDCLGERVTCVLFASDICKYLPSIFAQPRICSDSQPNKWSTEVLGGAMHFILSLDACPLRDKQQQKGKIFVLLSNFYLLSYISERRKFMQNVSFDYNHTGNISRSRRMSSIFWKYPEKSNVCRHQTLFDNHRWILIQKNNSIYM